MKSTKHIEDFSRSKCCPDIINCLGKLDLKEITEVMGMWSFVKKCTDILDNDNDKRFVVLDVGCGKRPTLGALIAHMRRNTTVFSIDPQVDTTKHKKVACARSAGLLANIGDKREGMYKGLHKVLSNLYTYCSSFENFMCAVNLQYSEDYSLICCCNHSHVTLKSILKYLPKPCHYFSNPCCHDNVPKDIAGRFIQDTHIWSEKNKIYYCEIK